MSIKLRYSPLKKPSFENLYHFLTGLSLREQLIVTGASILLIVLLVVLPLSMVSGKVNKLKKGISKSQSKSSEVIGKVSEYENIKAEIKDLEGKFGRGVSAMTTTVESLLRKADLQKNIKVLKEKPMVPGDRFTEKPVELKLKNVSLQKLVDLLYEIESYPDALLRIRSLQVKPRYSNRSLLNVSLDVANITLREEG